MHDTLRRHIEEAQVLAAALVAARMTSVQVANFLDGEWAAAARAVKQRPPVQGVRDMVLVIMGAGEIETAKQVGR